MAAGRDPKQHRQVGPQRLIEDFDPSEPLVAEQEAQVAPDKNRRPFASRRGGIP
jgi:hypothetical protein